MDSIPRDCLGPFGWGTEDLSEVLHSNEGAHSVVITELATAITQPEAVEQKSGNCYCHD
ncbi:MAG: hypothetical protein O2890_00125 [Cyanobacteria bacterium]|nr:hypothetical protein [Cyanobacteriota bacterium]MDA0864840.1 hypothetical protein [Cyanobacteriota bacterium]